MKNINDMKAAGIVTAAFFLSLIVVSAYAFDPACLTTDTINQISLSSWACDARHYDDMADAERLRKAAEDISFDSWVATLALKEGYQLGEKESMTINARKKELEIFALTKAIASETSPTLAQIKEYSVNWMQTRPERFEVFYIFIDTTLAATQEENETLHKRALWIKNQLTPDNFGDYARLWSDHPSSVEGGAFGAITLDQYGPTFTANIRQTPAGTIGGPYPTKSGWNIFYIRSYTPPFEPKHTSEQLGKMTAEVIASEKVKKIKQNEAEWNHLLKKYNTAESPYMDCEISALENFLLSSMYIRAKIAKISPTDEDLKKIYEEHIGRFTLAPRRKAREILLSSDDWTMNMTPQAWDIRRGVRDKARELRDKIMSGADFSEMAKKYSKSPSAKNGGDVGWIQEPSSFLYDSGLSPLKVGEVSLPLPTQKGYMLLQLVDIQSNQKIPFEEAREKCVGIWSALQHKIIREDLLKQYHNQ